MSGFLANWVGVGGGGGGDLEILVDGEGKIVKRIGGGARGGGGGGEVREEVERE